MGKLRFRGANLFVYGYIVSEVVGWKFYLGVFSFRFGFFVVDFFVIWFYVYIGIEYRVVFIFSFVFF